MVVVFFMLLSMFITIINEAFAAVCDDVSKQSNEYEMVDFMISRFKHWTGLSGVMRKLGKESSDDKLHDSEVSNSMGHANLQLVTYNINVILLFSSPLYTMSQKNKTP